MVFWNLYTIKFKGQLSAFLCFLLLNVVNCQLTSLKVAKKLIF
ncbi:hypothetical protein PFLA_a1882 [Pseudoalteromonas flavipulchra NCIMB 2033 = ATCC BAA-314]|nr:hypothetical protein [Pseudoalteromonas flavipulchra NCIMB 2033 = ATCC BAA-314]